MKIQAQGERWKEKESDKETEKRASPAACACIVVQYSRQDTPVLLAIRHECRNKIQFKADDYRVPSPEQRSINQTQSIDVGLPPKKRGPRRTNKLVRKSVDGPSGCSPGGTSTER